MSESDLRQQLLDRMFRGKLVENRWRGDLVEQIVANSLKGTGWTICSGDWNSWDFIHESKVKLQVKQSARLQTWGISPTNGRFGIAPAKGFYEGQKYIPLDRPRRLSKIYVFAYHGEANVEVADHWNIDQWKFVVASEASLPADSKSVAICEVMAGTQLDAADLCGAIERVRNTLCPEC